MSAQNAYTRIAPVGYEGLVFSAPEDTTIITGSIETAAGVPFGRGVSYGSLLEVIPAVKLGGDPLVGITIRSQDRENTGVISAYNQFESAGVLRQGLIWLVPKDVVAVNDAVFYDNSDGQFSNAIGLLFRGAKWMTATAQVGELALLDLDYVVG